MPLIYHHECGIPGAPESVAVTRGKQRESGSRWWVVAGVVAVRGASFGGVRECVNVPLIIVNPVSLHAPYPLVNVLSRRVIHVGLIRAGRGGDAAAAITAIGTPTNGESPES